MSEQSSNSTTLILELGDRLLKSWWTVIAGVCIGAAVGMFVLDKLPKVYEASTKIWVAEQQLPDSVVKSTVNDDMAMHLAAFRDAVVEQPYMIQLVEQTYGLPETEQELDSTIKRIRARLQVENVANRRHNGVDAFKLSYTDTDPRRAAEVVNALTQLYIRQNSEFRIRKAEAAASEIDRMADKRRVDLDAIVAELTEFRKKYGSETEAHLAANVQLLENRQRDLEVLGTKRSQLMIDLEQAENQLSQTRASLASSGTASLPVGVPIDPLTQRIADLKRELDQLRITNTEKHPAVQRKKRELEDVMAEARRQAANVPADPQVDDAEPIDNDPAVAAIQLRIREIRKQLAELDGEEVRLQRDIATFERRIENTPEVQRRLSELEERHAVAQEAYQKLLQNAQDARGTVELENTDLGEKMEVLEWATVPGSPISPDPRKIYMMFLVAGCLVFIGPMLARHALNPPIASESGLRGLTEVPVLVAIPRMMTPEFRGQSRRRLIANVAMSVLSVVLVVTVYAILNMELPT